jgi:hypothetical protein
MTNEEEQQAKALVSYCKTLLHGEYAEKLLSLAERLLAENSQLRVRDSNVTMHSLNVMSINEDLELKVEDLELKLAEEHRAPRVVYLAYLRDRAEQYKNSSGSRVAIENLIDEIHEGEHVKAWHAGELDDLIKELEK